MWGLDFILLRNDKNRILSIYMGRYKQTSLFCIEGEIAHSFIGDGMDPFSTSKSFTLIAASAQSVLRETGVMYSKDEDSTKWWMGMFTFICIKSYTECTIFFPLFSSRWNDLLSESLWRLSSKKTLLFDAPPILISYPNEHNCSYILQW